MPNECAISKGSLLAHRDGQALGLLMARRGLSSDDAFDELVRISQNTNTKVRDVAAAMVADAQPHPA